MKAFGGEIQIQSPARRVPNMEILHHQAKRSPSFMPKTNKQKKCCLLSFKHNCMTTKSIQRYYLCISANWKRNCNADHLLGICLQSYFSPFLHFNQRKTLPRSLGRFHAWVALKGGKMFRQILHLQHRIDALVCRAQPIVQTQEILQCFHLVPYAHFGLNCAYHTQMHQLQFSTNSRASQSINSGHLFGLQSRTKQACPPTDFISFISMKTV